MLWLCILRSLLVFRAADAVCQALSLFLSVCGQPGITIPSMQCMELSCVAGEPGLCANAVKLNALVIASASQEL